MDKKKILIVDDNNVDTRLLLSARLKAHHSAGGRTHRRFAAALNRSLQPLYVCLPALFDRFRVMLKYENLPVFIFAPSD
jgi:hypothetical protein